MAKSRAGVPSVRNSRYPEAKYFLAVVLGSSLMIATYLWLNEVYPAFLTALRHALFNVVSIATTTGFASVDYSLWPMFAPLWMLFLCSFATSAGSTGGGIKMMRAIILYKQVYRELLRAMHPNAIWPVRVGGAAVPQNILTAVLAFGFAYMCFLVVLTLPGEATLAELFEVADIKLPAAFAQTDSCG